MDDRPYKVITDLYRFTEEKQGNLDIVDATYITAVLKTLVDLYYEPADEPEAPKRAFKVSDIIPKSLGGNN